MIKHKFIEMIKIILIKIIRASKIFRSLKQIG